jgi:hypothetical protein
VSDYLASLAARNVNQNQGLRFLAGELRPRLASRFEPPIAGAAAWPESPSLLEKVTEQESLMPDMPSASPVTPVYHFNGERPTVPMTPLHHSDREHHPAAANHPASSSDLSSAEQGPEPKAGEMPSPTARVIEGIRHLPTEQNRPVGQVTRYGEEDETSPSKSHLSPPLSPQSQPVSATMPTSQSDTWPHHWRSSVIKTAQTLRETTPTVPEAMRQETIKRVSDRARPLQDEQPGLSERSDVVPEKRDQSLEPPQGDRAGETQRPNRKQSNSSSAQRLAVTNAATQTEIAPANSGASSRMPTPDQNLGVLQSVVARLVGPREQAQASAAPTVNVTIGRVEVRAVPAPTSPAPKPRSTPVMTLDEYLRRRATGGGS